MLQGFKTLLCFCVDTRSVLVPVIISTSPNSFPMVLTILTQKSNAFYYIFAFFPVCMSCSALHVIKEGFRQSYHWPTAVITKGMHSCLWLTRLGNVITKIRLIGGAQGAPCETLCLCSGHSSNTELISKQGPGAWHQMYSDGNIVSE